MRTFLNHIKNETLDIIKTSLENLWQQMIQLSEFFQYSFVLILKRKCLVRASRARSGESGTPSTIIYVRWSSRRYELGCDTPVVSTLEIRHLLVLRVTRFKCIFWVQLLSRRYHAVTYPDSIIEAIQLNCVDSYEFWCQKQVSGGPHG